MLWQTHTSRQAVPTVYLLLTLLSAMLPKVAPNRPWWTTNITEIHRRTTPPREPTAKDLPRTTASEPVQDAAGL